MMATFRKTAKLGGGTYGTVYAADVEFNHEHGEKTDLQVAVKRNYADPSASWIWSVRELDIMSRLKGHPFVVDLLDVSFGDPFTKDRPMTPIHHSDRCMKEDKMHFIMEFAPMDCSTFIKDRTKCNPHNIKVLITQLLLGLEFMHSRNVAHRDLKPANLVISDKPDEGLRLRICDFGMSQILTKAVPQTGGVATSWYRAPEICCAWSNYGVGSDMWSVGCIIFEMMSGVPYMNRVEDSDSGIFNAALRKSPAHISPMLISKMLSLCSAGPHHIRASSSAMPIERPSFLEQMALSPEFIYYFNSTQGSLDELLEVLTNLLKIDPADRYNVSQTLNHKFFDGMRAFINECRRKYPPTPPDLPVVKIINCMERQWAMRVAFTIYNRRAEIPWYKHRLLFHAIDVFDRYLEFCFDASNGVPLRPIETTFSGRLHTKHEVELRFYGCLYLMHKYYSTITYPLDWSAFSLEEFQDPSLLALAEKFEHDLIQHVLKYNIYRDTVLEMTDTYGHQATETLIRDLLYEYGSMTSWDGGSFRAMYRHIRKLDLNGNPSPVLRTGPQGYTPSPMTRIPGVFTTALPVR